LRIKRKDLADLTLVAVPTGPEDLWALYMFVEKGDLIVGKTHRVMKLGSADKTDKEKVLMVLEIRLEEKNLDLSSSKLNLSGKVVSAPEEHEGIMGKFQTISITVGHQLKVVKSKANPLLWKLLEKRAETKGPAVVVVAIESDSAAIGTVTNLGVMRTEELHSAMAGKDKSEQREQDKSKFLDKVAKTLGDYLRGSEAKIAVVGPGFMKDDFVSLLERKYPSIRKAVAVISTATSGTPAGIHESLRSGAVEKAAKHLRSMREVSLVEDFIRTAAQDDQRVAIGLDEVIRALRAGAVETLLILDTFLPVSNDNMRPENLARAAQEFGGNFYVINSRHEGGSKVKSLGGVVAFLRYRMELREANV